MPRPFADPGLPPLGGLQTDLFSSAQTPHDLRIHQCPNPEAEAVTAAREILRYVRDHGGRFRYVAVLVRSLTEYERVLSRVFRRYNIRFFLDRREPVTHHPLAELTRYALRIILSNWEHEDWFGALKTGLVHPNQGLIDLLENIALARGWSGSVWLAPLKLPGELELQRLEKLRSAAVRPFGRFADSMAAVRRQPTGIELASAIRQLWKELRVEETLEKWSEAAAAAQADCRDSLLQTEVHSQTWREMESWLDNLELAFETTRLPLGDWISVVESGLANLSAGVIPLALDEVLIGEVDRSRNPNLEMVLVLGMNETIFPAPPPAPPLLSEYDRESLEACGLALGMCQREQIGRERLLGYIACTRARRRVVLTYAERDLNDKPLNPSPFIDHVQRLFPGLQPELTASAVDWRQIIHESELVVPLLKNLTLQSSSKIRSLARLERLPSLQPLLHKWDQIQGLRSSRGLAPSEAERLYGPNLQVSISAFEDYAACPFKFFAVRGLRAEERQEFEVDRRERGSFQHEILMEFHRQLQAQGKRWRDLSPTEARDFLGRIATDVQHSFRDGLFASSPERCFDAKGLIEGLQMLIEALVGWAPQYGFEPQAVELNFGMEENGLNSWRIDLGDGHLLLLRGRIDRIDLRLQPGGEAYAVVIDYKAGGQELEQVKLINGLDLQLLAYLGVLRDAANTQAILGASKLIPAGAFYVGLRSSGGSGKNRGEVLDDGQSSRQLSYQHRGRFRVDLLAAFDNRELVRGDQFRYARNKDGAMSKMANEALPDSVFLGLVDQVQNFLRKYGQEIYAGNVDIAPFRFRQEKACDRCNYRSICRFDPWLEPYRVLKAASAGKAK